MILRKIMFVCHGNICRSPMAEFVCKDMLSKAGLGHKYEIESAAVSDEEIWGGVGNPVYPPVASLLKSKGIDTRGKRARKLVRADAEKYDLFVCMDESNLRGAVRILGERGEKKCVKLLGFLGLDEDVSDPWYTRDFAACYEDVERGVAALIENLEGQAVGFLDFARKDKE